MRTSVAPIRLVTQDKKKKRSTPVSRVKSSFPTLEECWLLFSRALGDFTELPTVPLDGLSVRVVDLRLTRSIRMVHDHSFYCLLRTSDRLESHLSDTSSPKNRREENQFDRLALGFAQRIAQQTYGSLPLSNEDFIVGSGDPMDWPGGEPDLVLRLLVGATPLEAIIWKNADEF